MMWNTRYGMMSNYSLRGRQGMMGSSGTMMGGPSAGGGWGMMGDRFRGDPWTPSGAQKPKISAAQARKIADRWLAENARGLAAGEADSFPGYFTLHTVRDGKVSGMLSVNAITGAVWYHWWHGQFVAMAE